MLERANFQNRKIAWRSKGHYVCKHGLFFTAAPANGCACMNNDWGTARLMPFLDVTLKAIV
eukprot:4180550-Karenia_brevis.AAC.1